MYLRQPGFTESACSAFTKIKERILKFKEIGDSRYIYQNKQDKVCLIKLILMASIVHKKKLQRFTIFF